MKRCPTCQRPYTDDSLKFCLEDGSTLLSDNYGSSDLPATVIIPDPRVTAPARPEMRSPNPLATYAEQPAWPPVAAQPAYPGVVSTQGGKGLALASLLCAIAAYLSLAFCIFGGAAGVEQTLLGGIFIFSILLGLAGAVLGIIAVAKTGKNEAAQNSRVMALIALVLSGLYLLISVVILILAALYNKS